MPIKRTRSPASANKTPRRKTPTTGTHAGAPAEDLLEVLQPTTIHSSTPSTSWLPRFMDFINNLTIESKEIGQARVGEHLWGSQRRFLIELAQGMDKGIRDFSFLKSRQLGVTTICIAVDLFWLFMHPGIHGCLLIDEEGNRDKLRLILRQYAMSLPRSMRYPIITDNRTLMSFDVGGKLSVLDFLVAGKRRGTLGASRAYRFLHASEVGNYGDEDGLENFLQTLSESHPDRLFIKESTANGFNHWRRMWLAAGQDQYSQHAGFMGWWSRNDHTFARNTREFQEYMKLPWSEEELELRAEVARLYGHLVTDEQLAWYRYHADIRSLNEGMLHQTQPWTAKQSFILSGRSFFPLRKVEKDLAVVFDGNTVTFDAYRYYLGQSFATTQIERVFHINDCELRVWEDPVLWGRYVIGCDPAFGRSDWNDSHAISVWRCFSDKLVQVAEYGSSEPETFQVTWALAHLASMYEDCYINFEVNGPGIAIKTELDRMRQILRSQSHADLVRARGWESALEGIKWYLYHRPDSLGRGYAVGFQTNFNTKMAMMNEVRDSYINDMFVIRSALVLEQMQYIVQDGGEIAPAAKGRNHDDFVFAMAFAHRAWLEWVRPDMIQMNYSYEAAQALDRARVEGRRPPVVSGIVGKFFDDKEQQRKDQQGKTWEWERGLR